LTFISGFFEGLGWYWKSWSLLRAHQRLRWLFIPGLFNLLLFIVVAFGAWWSAGAVIDYFYKQMELQWEDHWLLSIRWLFSLVLRLLVIAVYLRLYKYLLLIFFSPFLAVYSDKILFRFTGKKSEGGSIAMQILRGVVIAIGFLVLELWVWVVLFFLAWLVPALAPIVPLALLIFNAMLFGMALLDYSYEYAGMNPGWSIGNLFKAHKGHALGIGIGYQLLLLVPFFGILVGPMWSLAAACSNLGAHD
jgi:uncharacterized protein involved in cysteine biosynthesis